jgi:hypothetical protein
VEPLFEKLGASNAIFYDKISNQMNKLKGQSMNNQRGFLRIFFVLTVFGVMNLLHMLDSPAWANIRGVDILRLIGTGMCFGGAIFCFGAYFFGRRFTED